jgi:hypothetical protein
MLILLFVADSVPHDLRHPGARKKTGKSIPEKAPVRKYRKIVRFQKSRFFKTLLPPFLHQPSVLVRNPG